jgi:septal ring factor EnvC (AmiA/AmiB activator)
MNQDRTMQFILDNLAAVTASQQQAEVRAARTDRQIKGMQNLMLTGMKLILKLEKGQRELQKGLRELQKGHHELQSELKALAAAQKRTDQKLDRWLDSLNKGSNGHKKH